MNYVLLLGAGFSRNWGGWLATEAFEYLLGCPEASAENKQLLWDHRRKGGFQSALAELQGEHFRQGRSEPEPRLTNLLSAILKMFEDMNLAYEEHVDFEFHNHVANQVRPFLARFDAIFSLNQDLLVERHYSRDGAGRWNGWEMPGMRRSAPPPRSDLASTMLGEWKTEEGAFHVSAHFQPFFKLHGSTNWTDENAGGIMVLGGNKASVIKQFPVLKWSHKQFKQYLGRPETRLMIIGYGFGDNHINNAIRAAADGGQLQIFVIDPDGVDVMDGNRTATIYAPGDLATALWPYVIGASRRPLEKIFGSDTAEHAKVMRFFS